LQLILGRRRGHPRRCDQDRQLFVLGHSIMPVHSSRKRGVASMGWFRVVLYSKVCRLLLKVHFRLGQSLVRIMSPKLRLFKIAEMSKHDQASSLPSTRPMIIPLSSQKLPRHPILMVPPQPYSPRALRRQSNMTRFLRSSMLHIILNRRSVFQRFCKFALRVRTDVWP
jgi:hypothetical protein